MEVSKTWGELIPNQPINKKKGQAKKNKKITIEKKDITQMIDTYFDLCNNLLWK